MILRGGKAPGLPGLAAASLLLALGVAPAPAQLAGPEFQVNSFTADYQYDAAVGADDAGNFVVVWMSYGQDSSNAGIFGRRFLADGTPAGSEFQIPTYTQGPQTSPALAVGADGDFVVTWLSGQDGSDWGIFGQRFDAAGNRVGNEFQVNSHTTQSQAYSSMAAYGAGDFVVVWQSLGQDGSDDGVFGQRFEATGARVGAEFQVNSFTTGNQRRPVVAADDAGGFVVAWGSNHQDGSSYGVFGQRFDASGDRAGSEFQVNSYTTNVQWVPGVAADGPGNFVVTWNSLGQDGASWGVFGQRFDAAGARVGREFQVNSYTTNYQTTGSAVALDGAGNFVVAWNGYSGQDGSLGSGIFAQQFAFDGGPVGSEFRVNSYTTLGQQHPSVAAGPPGQFIVTWDSTLQDESGTGIFGQRLETPIPSCAADGDTLCLHHNRFRAEITWTDYAGATGRGKAIPFTADSGLFWFFGPGNLELLLKIVDGCDLNQRFWVYAGATTDVEYTLTVTDTWTDIAREYRNSLGHRAPAITDSGAFATCDAAGDGAATQAIPAARDLLPAAISQAATPTAAPAAQTDGANSDEPSCTPGDHDLCLHGSRFRARIGWSDYAGRTGSGWAVPYATESGMFWFFDADNIEFLVKVIDGCDLNDRYWVYAAATTDIAYTLTVTDTLGDATQTYNNVLGTASPAITDSSAFTTCP